VPVPARGMFWGEGVAGALALSVIVRVPFCEPVVIGLRVTLIVHCVPADKFAGRVPQVFVCAKGPLVVMFEIVSDALPAAVNVIDCDALVFPTATSPKHGAMLFVVQASRLAGPSPTPGALAGLIFATIASRSAEPATAGAWADWKEPTVAA
jgi:hypothetical protein